MECILPYAIDVQDIVKGVELLGVILDCALMPMSYNPVERVCCKQSCFLYGHCICGTRITATVSYRFVFNENFTAYLFRVSLDINIICSILPAGDCI